MIRAAWNKAFTMHILVVEDERKVASFIKRGLEAAHYSVDVEYDGATGLNRLIEGEYDLIILDVMLPKLDGLEVMKEIRQRRVNLPVLLLTAKVSVADKVTGLDLGADDYLTKPFSPQELVLRVGAILRRVGSAAGTGDNLIIRPIQIDKGTFKVSVDGAEVDLTATEFKLLLTLAESRGRVLGRGHLLQNVWEAAPDIQTRTVDMHIQRLRAKLGGAGDLIETVRGFGYRLSRGHSRKE